jgi:hypothetical protein
MIQCILALLLSTTILLGCSSEERKAATDKEAQRQVDRINDPINKAKKVADILEKHNQQQLPD